MRTLARELGAPSLGDTWKVGGSVPSGCGMLLSEGIAVLCPVTGLSLPLRRLSKI